MRKGYYLVTVFHIGGRSHDSKDFPFGEFKEIGFWLDEYGYIDPAYYHHIGFVEV